MKPNEQLSKDAQSASFRKPGCSAADISVIVDDARDVKNDEDVTNAVLNALKWNWQVPEDMITVKVKKGWCTLKGEVEYLYQRNAAENAIAHLMSVRGVTNGITINSKTADAVDQFTLDRVFIRNWSMNNGIKIEVKAHNVILSGTVGSAYEREEAGRIASNVPGIWSIDNELLVAFEDE